MQTKRIALALFAVTLFAGLAFAAGTAPKPAETAKDCCHHAAAKASETKACCEEHAKKGGQGDSSCCCCDDACERPARKAEAPKR